MWWEQLLVFAVLALAGGFALRRLLRGLSGKKTCGQCGNCSHAGKVIGAAGTSAVAPEALATTPPVQVVGDAT